MPDNVYLASETINISGLKLRVKEVCKELGITMKKVAEGVGVSPTYLSRVSQDGVKPNVKLVQKIADFLEVPVHRLIVAPKGYSHFYDEKGVWMGIRKHFEPTLEN